jgi:hypothetical protein
MKSFHEAMKIESLCSSAASGQRRSICSNYNSSEIWESVPISQRGSVKVCAFGARWVSVQLPPVQII